MVLLSCAGTSLGLAISASAGSEEVAIALIPVAVIPQIILSGAIAPLSGLPHWLAMLGVTTYWGKLGFDQLLPEDMLTSARKLDLAEEETATSPVLPLSLTPRSTSSYRF